jgi:hypothetical protein
MHLACARLRGVSNRYAARADSRTDSRKEVDMKTRLALIGLCVVAVAAAVPRTARATDDPATQERAHQTMTNDADASAQASTDMSYGGVPETHGASGHRTGKMCWPRPDCDVFFGH